MIQIFKELSLFEYFTNLCIKMICKIRNKFRYNVLYLFKVQSKVQMLLLTDRTMEKCWILVSLLEHKDNQGIGILSWRGQSQSWEILSHWIVNQLIVITSNHIYFQPTPGGADCPPEAGRGQGGRAWGRGRPLGHWPCPELRPLQGGARADHQQGRTLQVRPGYVIPYFKESPLDLCHFRGCNVRVCKNCREFNVVSGHDWLCPVCNKNK